MIIGFCGAAGSGKDTAGAAIIEHLEFKKLSFAAPLKRFLCLLFGWSMSSWESLEWKETPNAAANGRTPREVAQWFGTDFMRARIDPDFWVNKAVDGLEPGDKHVVTDVRFPNEARAIRAHGGVLIYVTCIGREVATDHAGHESEAWLPWLDLYVDCKIAAEFGAIDRLKEAAVNVVENYIIGSVPRFDPSPELLAALKRVETRVINSLS